MSFSSVDIRIFVPFIGPVASGRREARSEGSTFLSCSRRVKRERCERAASSMMTAAASDTLSTSQRADSCQVVAAVDAAWPAWPADCE